MFDWLRRSGRDSSKDAHPLASAARQGSPNELARVGHRLLGTAPAHKTLLASLLANPPMWNNDLTPADLAGSAPAAPPSVPGYALPAPLSAGMRASLAGQLALGQPFTKGDPTWDHPARG
jgi:hypothetical protein